MTRKKPKSNHEVIEAWRKVIRGENHEKKDRLRKKHAKMTINEYRKTVQERHTTCHNP